MNRVALFALLAALPISAAAAAERSEAGHTVAGGETLTGIADRAGVPVSVIAEANGLREPYKLRQGQRLAIPRQRLHTVKQGETGLAIAAKYGVPFAQVAVANNLDDKGTVRIGQQLIIPAMMAPPPAPGHAGTSAQPYFRLPHDGKILLGFARRADGSGHDGIDFAAGPLDMVRAAASGTVSGISRHNPRFGNLVTIDHGNGWKSAYGHLARITVAMGDVVKTGERIGLAGHSGQASGTEVHFMIRRDGKAVDPAPLLAK